MPEVVVRLRLLDALKKLEMLRKDFEKFSEEWGLLTSAIHDIKKAISILGEE